MFFYTINSSLWKHVVCLPIFANVILLELGLSYDDLSAGGVSLSLYSLSGKTAYRQISWSLEVARLDVNEVSVVIMLMG